MAAWNGAGVTAGAEAEAEESWDMAVAEITSVCFKKWMAADVDTRRAPAMLILSGLASRCLLV